MPPQIMKIRKPQNYNKIVDNINNMKELTEVQKEILILENIIEFGYNHGNEEKNWNEQNIEYYELILNVLEGAGSFSFVRWSQGIYPELDERLKKVESLSTNEFISNKKELIRYLKNMLGKEYLIEEMIKSYFESNVKKYAQNADFSDFEVSQNFMNKFDFDDKIKHGKHENSYANPNEQNGFKEQGLCANRSDFGQNSELEIFYKYWNGDPENVENSLMGLKVLSKKESKEEAEFIKKHIPKVNKFISFPGGIIENTYFKDEWIPIAKDKFGNYIMVTNDAESDISNISDIKDITGIKGISDIKGISKENKLKIFTWKTNSIKRVILAEDMIDFLLLFKKLIFSSKVEMKKIPDFDSTESYGKNNEKNKIENSEKNNEKDKGKGSEKYILTEKDHKESMLDVVENFVVSISIKEKVAERFSQKR